VAYTLDQLWTELRPVLRGLIKLADSMSYDDESYGNFLDLLLSRGLSQETVDYLDQHVFVGHEEVMAPGVEGTRAESSGAVISHVIDKIFYHQGYHQYETRKMVEELLNPAFKSWVKVTAALHESEHRRLFGDIDMGKVWDDWKPVLDDLHDVLSRYGKHGDVDNYDTYSRFLERLSQRCGQEVAEWLVTNSAGTDSRWVCKQVYNSQNDPVIKQVYQAILDPKFRSWLKMEATLQENKSKWTDVLNSVVWDLNTLYQQATDTPRHDPHVMAGAQYGEVQARLKSRRERILGAYLERVKQRYGDEAATIVKAILKHPGLPVDEWIKQNLDNGNFTINVLDKVISNEFVAWSKVTMSLLSESSARRLIDSQLEMAQHEELGK